MKHWKLPNGIISKPFVVLIDGNFYQQVCDCLYSRKFSTFSFSYKVVTRLLTEGTQTAKIESISSMLKMHPSEHIAASSLLAEHHSLEMTPIPFRKWNVCHSHPWVLFLSCYPLPNLEWQCQPGERKKQFEKKSSPLFFLNRSMPSI